MIWTKRAHQSAKFQTFDFSCKISPNMYFDRLLLLKVCKILAKKVYTEELCLMTLKIDEKFEEKLICCFRNDRNLMNFDPRTWSLKNLHFHWFLLCKVKVPKLGLWWDSFVQSGKCMSSKFTEELCVMTMKNDRKIEEELTSRFKTDMRNFTNFDPSTRKSKNFVF